MTRRELTDEDFNPMVSIKDQGFHFRSAPPIKDLGWNGPAGVGPEVKERRDPRRAHLRELMGAKKALDTAVLAERMKQGY